MALDSAASFKARMRDLGLPQTHQDAFEGRNVRTFAAFAFISPYQPNSQDEKPFVDALTDILGVAPGDHLPKYRRLFYESHTMAIQDLRVRLDSREGQEPRKLAMPERMERLGRLKASLTGLTLDAQLEPSHALVDRVVSMAEEQSIYYLELSLCTSRETEVNMLKKEPARDGSIRLSKKHQEASADTAGELRVRMCMQRRALAFQVASIATFVTIDTFISKLFSLLTRRPISGYRSVTSAQIIAADQALWQKVAQDTRGQVLTSGDPKPVDKAVMENMDSAEVTYHLLPLRDSASSKTTGDDKENPDKRKKSEKEKKKKKDDKPDKVAKIDIPSNCTAKNDSNQNICFGYNRKSCPVRGAKCRRGLHICWRKGCYGKHTYPDCNKDNNEWQQEAKPVTSFRQDPAKPTEPESNNDFNTASVSSSAKAAQTTKRQYPDRDCISLWNFDFKLPVSLHSLAPLDLGRDSEDFVFAEVFAGSGNLSESVRNAGLAVHAIDSVSKRQSGVAIHTLDLTKENDSSILLDIACHGLVASAHFAPPCGTSSKAREKPLPPEMSHIKSDPLQSDGEPLGLQGLSGLDALRVAAANKLYALTVVVATILLIRGASISIENPSNSYFWKVVELFLKQHKWLQAIWSSLIYTDFQACMYGSSRDKWTKLICSKGLYDDINKACDGSHAHASWRPSLGKAGANFPTSREKEYPKELCEAMAASLIRFLVHQGVRFPAEKLQYDTAITARHLRQHGKKPLPPLMAEYWLIADADIAKQFTHYKPIRLLPKFVENGGDVLDASSNMEQWCAELEQKCAMKTGTVVKATKKFSEVEQWFGVWRTPEQSIGAAECIEHPSGSTSTSNCYSVEEWAPTSGS